jgi:hypothetical protein
MLGLAGPAAFYVGLAIAILAMLVTPVPWLYYALAVLGIVAGIANVTAKETGPYLFASVAFIVTAMGIINVVTALGSTTMAAVLNSATLTTSVAVVRLAANITVFVGVGAVIIALRAIWGIAKSE